MTEYNPDVLAGTYIRMRTKIAELEQQITEIKVQQQVIADKLLALCNEQGANTISTDEGTVSRRLQSSFWTNDWGSFYQFVEEHSAFHLLEKRIHNGNMKEFLEANPDAIPAGMQANQKYVIHVRKPTKK
jgi:hypothetical protein